MQDDSDSVNSYLHRYAVSQKVLARRAGVSQSTVSRARKSHPAKHSDAHVKLLHFIRNDARLDEQIDEPAKRVIAAFRRVWDGTDAHVRAICHVIDALAEFQQPLPSKNHED